MDGSAHSRAPDCFIEPEPTLHSVLLPRWLSRQRSGASSKTWAEALWCWKGSSGTDHATRRCTSSMPTIRSWTTRPLPNVTTRRPGFGQRRDPSDAQMLRVQAQRVGELARQLAGETFVAGEVVVMGADELVARVADEDRARDELEALAPHATTEAPSANVGERVEAIRLERNVGLPCQARRYRGLAAARTGACARGSTGWPLRNGAGRAP